MANIKTSALVADIKGKIGGNCFARNKAGIYVRAKIKPINPMAIRQQQRRAAISVAAAAWGKLTSNVRAGWQAYALNTSWTNRLGDSINIGGEAAFVRLACMRLLAGLALPTAAPLEYGHASGTIATITAAVSVQTIVLAEPSTGWVKKTVGDQLLIFIGMPQSVGRSMMPSRWYYKETLVGSGATVSFPYNLGDLRWIFAEGQRVGIGMVHIDPENRISVRTTAFCYASAS